MKITFYKSILRPRCALAGLALKKIIKKHPALEIETVEVTTNPARAWQDGIRMIPAIRCEDKTLSGVMLSKAAINSFLKKNLANF
jgi:hypothetical protein